MTRAYTPGYAGLAQPYPQLTTPASVHVPERSIASGPPLSPWHESRAGSVSAAQSIVVASYALPTGSGYEPHAAVDGSVSTRTVTPWSWVGYALPDVDVLPQPLTKALVPAGGHEVLEGPGGGRAIAARETPSRDTGVCRVRIATSFSLVPALYDGWLTMADTPIRVVDSARLPTPARTCTALGARPGTQCAAVATVVELSREPPQNCAL